MCLFVVKRFLLRNFNVWEKMYPIFVHLLSFFFSISFFPSRRMYDLGKVVRTIGFLGNCYVISLRGLIITK